MGVIKGDDGFNYIEVDCLHLHSTAFAVLLDNGSRKEWFPKSCLEDWPDRGEYGPAIIQEQIAIDKHFI